VSSIYILLELLVYINTNGRPVDRSGVNVAIATFTEWKSVIKFSGAMPPRYNMRYFRNFLNTSVQVGFRVFPIYIYIYIYICYDVILNY
jgi:hypothetical protein